MVTRGWCLLLALSLAGCGGYGEIWYPKRLAAPVPKVSIEVVPAPDVVMSADRLSQLRTVFTSELEGHVPIVSPGDPDAFAVRGVIEVYDPGVRAVRAFFGVLRYGTGYFRSAWMVKDPAGVLVADCRISGSIRMGWWGGSYTEVLTRAAERLRQCLRR